MIEFVPLWHIEYAPIVYEHMFELQNFTGANLAEPHNVSLLAKSVSLKSLFISNVLRAYMHFTLSNGHLNAQPKNCGLERGGHKYFQTIQ